MNQKSDLADLTVDQRNYLNGIDPTKAIIISPFEKSAKVAGLALVELIKQKTEINNVYLIGSLMLEISGSNDIDVMCFCEKEVFVLMKSKLSELFQGANFFDRGSYLEWTDVTRDDFQATVYLNDIYNDKAWHHVEFTKRLLENPRLALEYERAKNEGLKIGGKISYRIYMEKKYRFINEVLIG